MPDYEQLQLPLNAEVEVPTPKTLVQAFAEMRSNDVTVKPKAVGLGTSTTGGKK